MALSTRLVAAIAIVLCLRGCGAGIIYRAACLPWADARDQALSEGCRLAPAVEGVAPFGLESFCERFPI